MKKKEYIAPNFNVIVLRSKHRLLDGSPYRVVNTNDIPQEDIIDDGGDFD